MADGDSHGVVGSNGGYVDHGWQKVTNVKKQKRQESKAKVGEKASTKSASSDSKLFQALEEESADRRAKREARIQAALAGDAHSEEDSDAENEKPVQANETEVKKPKVKKPKKPKVTVAEAAAGIDISDLSTFLSDISVRHFSQSRVLGLQFFFVNLEASGHHLCLLCVHVGPGESRRFASEAAVQYPVVALFASGECVLERCIFDFVYSNVFVCEA